MQSEGEEEIKKSRNQVEPEPELSEAWRTLLGMQSTGMQAQVDDHKESGGDQRESQGDHKASPLLANDPWSHLVHLQQLRLHAAHVPLSDIDVEKVLKMMQEAPSQYGSQE
jgi:hypothetical protein